MKERTFFFLHAVVVVTVFLVTTGDCGTLEFKGSLCNLITITVVSSRACTHTKTKLPKTKKKKMKIPQQKL